MNTIPRRTTTATETVVDRRLRSKGCDLISHTIVWNAPVMDILVPPTGVAECRREKGREQFAVITSMARGAEDGAIWCGAVQGAAPGKLAAVEALEPRHFHAADLRHLMD